MSVTSVHKDPEQLAMTLTADYDVSVERAWQLWADPRQLERWWGPPSYPATFEEHDLRTGGRATYFMTGPTGDQPRGWWQILSAEPPRLLMFESGFADAAGARDLAMPTMVMRVDLAERAGGVTMTIETRFSSLEAMEQIVAMGFEAGLQQAVGQIEAILAGAFAQ